MKISCIGILATLKNDKVIRRIGPMALIYSPGSGYVIYHCLAGGNWSSWDCVSSFSERYGNLSEALDSFLKTVRVFGLIKSSKL